MRLPEELLAWADAFSKTCGCTRTDLIAKGLCLIRESGPDGEPCLIEPASESVRQVREEKARNALLAAATERNAALWREKFGLKL